MIKNSDLEVSEKIDNNIELSIIVPVFNNVNFTKNAVKDLLKLPGNCEIVIVDNASTDETPEVIYELMNQRDRNKARLKYISCHKNLGFGRANNKGYKHSQGKYVLFLNNDIRVKSDLETWIDSLLEQAWQGKLVSANGGLLDSDFNFISETDHYIESPYFYLSGWCLMGSRETFDKLILNHFSDDSTDEIKEGRAWGPWNEKFFAYFEDDDLSWRAKELNITLAVTQVPLVHFGRMTSKKVNLQEVFLKSKKVFTEIWQGKK